MRKNLDGTNQVALDVLREQEWFVPCVPFPFHCEGAREKEGVRETEGKGGTEGARGTDEERETEGGRDTEGARERE